MYYKGFNKDMTCKGFQYEEGKEYHEEEAIVCRKGFHACEYPLDCFNYYKPAESVFHEVELGEDAYGDGNNTKKCSKSIKVGARLDIAGIIKAAINYTREICVDSRSGGNRSAISGGDWSALSGENRSALSGGDRSAISGGYQSALSGGYQSAISGGYQSAISGENRSALSGGDWSALSGGNRSAISGGDQSAISGGYRSSISGGDWSAISGGDWSAISGGYQSAISGGDWSAISGGDQSAISGGDQSVLRGGKECKYRGGLWSVFAAEIYDDNELIGMKTAVVDGENIKPNTWYQFDGKEFIESNE